LESWLRWWFEEGVRLGEMDDTDRKLMLLICENPRMPSREIAKRLGISRQAAHHRLQAMAKAGVFKSVLANISIHYIGGFNVMIFGRSKTASIEKTLDRLGNSELTYRVSVAGGNYLYVIGFLRNISEIDGYFEFVKQAAEMQEPTLGIVCYGDGVNPDWADGFPKQGHRKLSTLDLRIIASLRDDARKPIVEIADSVGVSARTVRRRLDIMRSEGSLDFDQLYDITSGEDMLTLVHVNLREGADRRRVGRRLISKDPVHFVLMRSFSNLPDFLLGLLSSDKMTEIRKLLREISEDEDVLAVTPNQLYFERMYATWDLRLLPSVGTSPSEKGGKHERSRPRIR
jgi:DNA-binding Lrp family transcriptional regulator